ncbi:CBS domain-containing protein [Aureimonas sp. SA4125]|uniref:CBS domain-containing protein n=1 Tax=Aureimonas sp. SA4125 TaxID=2826993 RepID=UPI001CC795BD|nr:CBS domain-containing protein [Aureimonas sp. SA4125]BDA86930.1 CBS domain-containing protein [Aureimonas sp. SA4125]
MSYSLSKPYDHFETSEEILEEVQLALEGGAEPVDITVREFLWWFDAQRRGPSKVAWINSLLNTYNLVTVPDYTETYIDDVIQICLFKPDKSEESVAVEAVFEQASINFTDPLLRVGSLPSASTRMIVVAPDDSIGRAVTLMMTHDFSQLPVLTTPREIKGIISWRSIGERLASGVGGKTVKDFMDSAVIINKNSYLFSTIRQVIDNEYVLVRDTDQTLSGIVTTTDLSLQFQQITEPFLLLNEIESQIRIILQKWIKCDNFTLIKILNLTDKYNSVYDLTFGQYLRIFQNVDIIPNPFPLNIDRTQFCSTLDAVRVVRNEVMHFSPDPMPDSTLPMLRKTSRYLQVLQTMA